MPTTKREDLAELIHFAIIGLDAQIAELKGKRAQLAALTDRQSPLAAVETTTPRKRREISAATKAKISAAQKARWTRERKEKAEEPQLNAVIKTARPKVKMIEPAPERPKAKVINPAPARAKAKTIEPAPERPKAKAILIKRGQVKTETIELAPARAKAKTIEPAPERPKARIIKPAPDRSKARESTAESDKAAKSDGAKNVMALPDKEIGETQTTKPDLNTPAGIVEQLALAGARFRITRGGSLIIGNLGSLPPVVQRMFLDHPNPQLLTAAARRYLANGTQSSEN